MPLPTPDQTAKTANPRDGARHCPPRLVAPQLTTVLPRQLHSRTAMGTEPLPAPSVHRLRQAAASPAGSSIICSGCLRGRPGPWRGTAMGSRVGSRRGRRVQEVSQRHPLAVDPHHPLRALDTCGLGDAGPPGFAGAQRPSANASDQARGPRASRWAKKARHAWSHMPCSSQSRRRPQQVLGGGKRSGRSGHRAPER